MTPKPAQTQSTPSPKRNNNSWAMALLPYIEHPEKYDKSVVYEYNDEIVAIYDLYPKAKKHFLVLPRLKIESITKLNKDHVSVLKKMYQMATKILSE